MTLVIRNLCADTIVLEFVKDINLNSIIQPQSLTLPINVCKTFFEVSRPSFKDPELLILVMWIYELDDVDELQDEIWPQRLPKVRISYREQTDIVHETVLQRFKGRDEYRRMLDEGTLEIHMYVR